MNFGIRREEKKLQSELNSPQYYSVVSFSFVWARQGKSWALIIVNAP